MKMYKMNDMTEFQFDESFVNEIRGAQKKDTPMIFLPKFNIVIETTKGMMTLAYNNMVTRDKDYNALLKIVFNSEIVKILDL